MRFKITGDHRKVFEKQKYIEFENIVRDTDVVANSIDTVLSKRARKLIANSSPQELFQWGRNLFQDDNEIRNFVTHSTLAQIGGQLFQQTRMLIAYDQVLKTEQETGYPSAPPMTLQQKSCIQPLAGAVILRCKGASQALPFLPQTPENVVFISPDLFIPWEGFFQEPHHTFLLIAYAPTSARYVLEKNDIHTHTLKKSGLVFGDMLRQDLNPVVYR